MSSSTSTPSSSSQQLLSSAPTSLLNPQPNPTSIPSDSEDSNTLSQVINPLTPALLRIVSQYNDCVRVADARFPTPITPPPTQPGHSVAHKRLVYEEDPVQMKLPHADNGTPAIPSNQSTPLPSSATSSTMQTSHNNVTVSSEPHVVSEHENVSPGKAPEASALPVEEESNVCPQHDAKGLKAIEVSPKSLPISYTANEIQCAEQDMEKEIALAPLLPAECVSQTSNEINNCSTKTPRASAQEESHTPPVATSLSPRSARGDGQTASYVSSPRIARIAGKGLVTVMSDTDIENMHGATSPSSCTHVPKIVRSSDIGPDARRRGRIARSRRSRFTVPIPFSLMGPILQERTLARIEEQRRVEDEAARKPRVFHPRSMPDFSRPSPTPRGP